MELLLELATCNVVTCVSYVGAGVGNETGVKRWRANTCAGGGYGGGGGRSAGGANGLRCASPRKPVGAGAGFEYFSAGARSVGLVFGARSLGAGATAGVTFACAGGRSAGDRVWR